MNTQEKRQEASERKGTPIHASPNSVLVIDDNHAIRVVLRDLLELEGFMVMTANNGLEALEVLQNFRPKVILLDMRMPVMDGPEFRKAQLDRPEIADIPLFVFSAGNRKDTGLAEMHPTGLLNKPIDIDNLLNSIRPFLS